MNTNGTTIWTALAFFSAWLTHVIYCLATGKIGFLIAGALLFPIGIIHGFMIWLGAIL